MKNSLAMVLMESLNNFTIQKLNSGIDLKVDSRKPKSKSMNWWY